MNSPTSPFFYVSIPDSGDDRSNDSKVLQWCQSHNEEQTAMKQFYEITYRYFRAPWDIGAREELVSLVEGGRIQPSRAIDLGCGTGANVIYLAQHGFDVTGVAYVEPVIEQARARARDAGSWMFIKGLTGSIQIAGRVRSERGEGIVNKWLRRMLKGLIILVGIFIVLVIGLVSYVQLFADRPLERPVRQIPAPKDAQTVARGEFLYNSSNLCWGCHGSEGSYRPDEPQAGGRKFDLSNVGPGFGVFYATNLTPDIDTGIGAWSDGELVRAIREGLDRQGRLILPVMPYQFGHGMSDEDALALVAYVRSLPPVHHTVPPNEPTLVYRALGALGILKPEPAISTPVVAPPKGVTAEYGEYLAWRTSGCAECHMPRNMNTGELDFTRRLAGALSPIDEEGIRASASNLTPDAATGIGQWTEEQFMTAMRTGQRPNGTVMLPFMPWPSYSRWTDDDLKAIWLCLRTLPPVDHQVASSTSTGAAAAGRGIARGEALFGVYCRVCHGDKGTGAPLTHVVLKDAVRGMDQATVIALISKGLGTSMPGFGKTLTEEQMSDLVAFIRTW